MAVSTVRSEDIGDAHGSRGGAASHSRARSSMRPRTSYGCGCLKEKVQPGISHTVEHDHSEQFVRWGSFKATCPPMV